MTYVLMAIVALFALGLLMLMAQALGIIALLASVYFFAEGDIVYAILSLVVLFVCALIAPKTATINYW